MKKKKIGPDGIHMKLKLEKWIFYE